MVEEDHFVLACPKYCCSVSLTYFGAFQKAGAAAVTHSAAVHTARGVPDADFNRIWFQGRLWSIKHKLY